MKLLRLAALLPAAVSIWLAAGAARAATPVHYVEIGSIGAPANAAQLVYSSAYQKLVLRNGGSAVVVLDLTDGSTDTLYSQTLFTDMSLSPDGRYVFVADYGGENIGYGTALTPSYVTRIDLSTKSWQTKSAGAAIAYHVEAVDSEYFILTSIDQWISFTYDRWGSNDSSFVVLTPTTGFQPGYYAGVYFGDIEYDPTTGRLIHGDSGSSSQEITAFEVSGNSFSKQEESGIYGTAQGYGGTAVLSVDGSAFYYGRLQVDALDVRHNRRVFPELIYAANGRAALGNGKYFDATSGALLGSLGFPTTVYGTNESGNDFWAYDSRSDSIRHYFASDEPLPPEAQLANADHARTTIGEAVDVDVLDNDFGFASPVTVDVTTAPSHGTATVTGSPGEPSGVRVHYVPAPGFSGSDSFVYTVTDGTNTDSATATIAVDSYRARADTYVLSRDEVGYTTLHVASNDTGFIDPVSLSVTTQPTHGFTSIGFSGNAQDVYVTYYADYSAPSEYEDTFTYSITDGTHTDSATVTLQIYTLKAFDDEATTAVGTPVAVDVTQNDIHQYGLALRVGLFETAQHGTIQTNGSVMTYTPDPGFVGTDSFVYAIDDETRVSFGTVTVHVIHDVDGDHVADELDNCTFVPNADQRDTDGDGHGNICDADLDNDGMVNFRDLALLRMAFGTADPAADLDGNGIVNFADLDRLRSLFLQSPGPSDTNVPAPEPDAAAAAAGALASIALRYRLRRRR